MNESGYAVQCDHHCTFGFHGQNWRIAAVQKNAIKLSVEAGSETGLVFLVKSYFNWVTYIEYKVSLLSEPVIAGLPAVRERKRT